MSRIHYLYVSMIPLPALLRHQQKRIVGKGNLTLAREERRCLGNLLDFSRWIFCSATTPRCL